MSASNEPGPGLEPIRMPWVWVGLIALIVAGVPWYLPEGMIGPTLFGFPVWTLVSVASTLMLCGYLSWMLLRRWNLIEDTEQRAERGNSSHDSPSHGRPADHADRHGDERD